MTHIHIIDPRPVGVRVDVRAIVMAAFIDIGPANSSETGFEARCVQLLAHDCPVSLVNPSLELLQLWHLPVEEVGVRLPTADIAELGARLARLSGKDLGFEGDVDRSRFSVRPAVPENWCSKRQHEA